MPKEPSQEAAPVLLVASDAQNPRVWRAAISLSTKGYRVHVLEWDRNSRLPSHEVLHGITAFRMRLRAPYGPKLLLFFPIWQIFIVAFCLAKKYRVVQPQNLDNSLTLLPLAKLKGIRMIYDLADYYPDAYVEGNAMMKLITRWLEITLIRSADCTILPDESRLGQLGVYPRKFCIIYNSPSTDDMLEASLGRNEDLHARFGVFYAGILARDRGLDYLVKACETEGTSLIIAGFGSDQERITRIISKSENAVFLGRIPHSEVIERTMQSDCIVCLYDPSIENNRFASPNKLFEAMMCGKPVVVSDRTAMSKRVIDDQCGWIVQYGDVPQLRSVLTHLRDNVRAREQAGAKGRAAYDEKYSWARMESRLAQLYMSVLASEEVDSSHMATPLLNPDNGNRCTESTNLEGRHVI